MQGRSRLNCCTGGKLWRPVAEAEDARDEFAQANASRTQRSDCRPLPPNQDSDIDGDLYLMIVECEGQLAPALIDSGASSNFVNRQALSAERTIDRTTTMDVRGFNGTIGQTLGRTRMTFRECHSGTTFDDVAMHVVEDSPFPIVPGTPFLHQHRLK
jgi:hypothetical protein